MKVFTKISGSLPKNVVVFTKEEEPVKEALGYVGVLRVKYVSTEEVPDKMRGTIIYDNPLAEAFFNGGYQKLSGQGNAIVARLYPRIEEDSDYGYLTPEIAAREIEAGKETDFDFNEIGNYIPASLYEAYENLEVLEVEEEEVICTSVRKLADDQEIELPEGEYLVRVRYPGEFFEENAVAE